MSLSINSFIRYAKQIQEQAVDEKAVIHTDETGTNFSQVVWQKLGHREGDFKEQNRVTRQALVNSLRQACGGVSFDNLPESIKSVLNLDDFQLDANGVVKSTRPLTARRLIAITKAVTAWRFECRKACDVIASSPNFVNQPDPRKAENALARLFDPKRPLPSNLSVETLKTAGDFMFRKGLKPFQVRLALECFSDLTVKGTRLPSHGAPAQRLADLAKQMADVIGPRIAAFGSQTASYVVQHRHDDAPDPNPPAFILDGVGANGLGNDDLSGVYNATIHLLKKADPGLAKLLDGMTNADFGALGDAHRTALDAEQALALEKQNFVSTFPNGDPTTPEETRRLAELDTKLGVCNARVSIIARFCDVGALRFPDPGAIDYQGDGVRQLDRPRFANTIRHFNETDTKSFSAEKMFVRDGKPGINGFDEKVKVSFKGVDRKGFGTRAQRVARAQTQVTVLEEMWKQTHRPVEETQFNKDCFRSNIINGLGRLMPNQEGSEQQLDDAFAQELRRKDNARYADLNPFEKRKIMLLKSMLHQFLERIPYSSATIARSTDCNIENVGSIQVANCPPHDEDCVYQFNFDDDGGLSVSVFRYKEGGYDPETDSGAEIGLGMVEGGDEDFGEVKAKEGQRIGSSVRIDMHISPEEVDRIAKLDWQNFDYQPILTANNQMLADLAPHRFENFPRDHIPEAFRLDIDTHVSVSYELTNLENAPNPA